MRGRRRNADAFTEMREFSARNLEVVRSFAEAWPDESIVQEALAIEECVRRGSRRASKEDCSQLQSPVKVPENLTSARRVLRLKPYE